MFHVWRFRPHDHRLTARAVVFRADGRISRELVLSTYVLKLYVAGMTARTQRAIANLQRICEEELLHEYELVVIDVLENPQLAEDDRILATPTLIKQLPPPLRRVVGDLSDRDKVLLGLEVRPGAPSTRPNPSPPNK